MEPAFSETGSFVIADAADLVPHLVKRVFLEWRVRVSPRPPIGHFVDLALPRLAHDLLTERIALLALDVLIPHL